MSDVKFQFSNIGPITQADLRLGDLTIVAGKNNTGKTYLGYTLYGFLKMWDQWPGIVTGTYTGEAIDVADIVDLATRAANRGEAAIDIDSARITKERQSVIEAISTGFSEDALRTVFSSDHNSFESASLDITFPNGHALPRSASFRVLNLDVEYEYDGRKLVLKIKQEKRRRPTGVAQSDTDVYPTNLIADVFYTNFLFPELDARPFVLSAERFGISLFYKELDFTKNQLVDMLQSLANEKDSSRLSPYLLIDKSTSRYALPIKDNIEYTRSLSDIKNDKSEYHDRSFFDGIKEMMGGHYTTRDDEIMFIADDQNSSGFDIPLHLASSSVRGLSDMYFFLRHLARHGHVLIIDEPESHLDTNNQVILARLLARVARAGIRVFLTTHSDYVVKEINNLIMLDSEFPGRESTIDRLGYERDDALSPSVVKAYVAAEGSLRECAIDEFGIDMPVFDDTIDRINSISNQLSAEIFQKNQLPFDL